MDTTTAAATRRARWQLAGLTLTDLAVLGALVSPAAPLPGLAAIVSGSVEEAVLAAGRLTAVALAGWLLASLVVAAALAVRPGSRLLRAWTSTLAPRLVRAVAARAAGVALLAGTLAPSVAVAAPHPGPTTPAPLAPPALLPVERAGGAAAPTGTAPAPPVATDAVPAPRVAAPDDRTTDDAAPPARTGTSPRPPAPPTPRSGPRPGTPPHDATTVTVAPGDHLWGLTARALAAARGVAVDHLDPAEIVGPWRATVERNRGHLRSGDPDVIHPGEVVVLATDPRQEERP